MDCNIATANRLLVAKLKQESPDNDTPEQVGEILYMFRIQIKIYMFFLCVYVLMMYVCKSACNTFDMSF